MWQNWRVGEWWEMGWKDNYETNKKHQEIGFKKRPSNPPMMKSVFYTISSFYDEHIFIS